MAGKELVNLKVDLRTRTKVVGCVTLSDGRFELTLSGGDKLVTDMYVPTFGLTPNSSFVPSKYLDSSGFIVVDEYLGVKGTADVWAIGDVNQVEWAQFISCEKQSTYLAKNIVLLLSNKSPLPYKPAGSRMSIFSP